MITKQTVYDYKIDEKFTCTIDDDKNYCSKGINILFRDDEKNMKNRNGAGTARMTWVRTFG